MPENAGIWPDRPANTCSARVAVKTGSAPPSARGRGWRAAPPSAGSADSGTPRASRPSAPALQQGHPVVGGEAADGLGQADMGLHLPPLRPPRELPAELHELGDPGCRQRVPARLEPAG